MPVGVCGARLTGRDLKHKMRMRRLLILLTVALAAGAAVLILTYTNSLALDENNCLSCHGSKDLVKTTETGRKISLYVSEERVNTAATVY